MRENKEFLFADLHTHSRHSHDGKETVAAMAEAALRCGVGTFAVTDHADLQYWEERRVPHTARESFQEAQAVQEDFSGRVKILRGIEIGEAIWEKEKRQELLSACPYDFVISSVHAVRFPGETEPYSVIDFSKFSLEKVEAYLAQYFEDVLETVQTVDFHVLPHLTCPLRYIVGKYHFAPDLSKSRVRIDEILQTAIRREIALEVNTSGLFTPYRIWMPDETILSRYAALGGKRITLGSDAHRREDVGKGFEETAPLLRKYGFTHCSVFENQRESLLFLP